MSSDLVPALAPSAQEIADVIGRDNALTFIGKLPSSGNRRWRVCVYIPKQITPDHKLVGLLGWSDACKMVEAFTGMILQPSNCRNLYRGHRNRQIVRLADEGMPVDQIAEYLELSVYWVREIIGLQSGAVKPKPNGGVSV